MDYVIRRGNHPPELAWTYTPRELTAWATAIVKGERRDRAEALTVAAMGSRGDPKKVQQLLKDWTR